MSVPQRSSLMEKCRVANSLADDRVDDVPDRPKMRRQAAARVPPRSQPASTRRPVVSGASARLANKRRRLVTAGDPGGVRVVVEGDQQLDGRPAVTLLDAEHGEPFG